MDSVIEKAKTFERRRCGHRPDTHPEPLSTLECLLHCVDEKQKGENKHRYVVATQDQEVRRRLRAIAGVPLIYIVRRLFVALSRPSLLLMFSWTASSCVLADWRSTP